MGLSDLIPGVSQAKLILAGVGLAAVAAPTTAWLITRHTLHIRTEKLADAVKAGNAEIAAHNVTLASLSQCMAVNQANKLETDKLSQQYADSQKQAVADAQKLSDARKADATRIETLQALAKNLPASGCKAPSALIENARGL